MIFTKGWITELATVPLSVLSIHFVLGSSTTPRLLGLLGLMSYTLYVSHVASIALVAALLEQGGIAPPYLHPATWWVALPVALCVSAISYLAFEAPSRRALERLRSPGGPRPAR